MSANQLCAVIGLGNMGIEVAGRLALAGPVRGFDTSPERIALATARFLPVADTLIATVAGASAVVLSLPTPAVSLATVQTLAQAMPRGTLIIETSTVIPSDTAKMLAICDAAGIGFIDAAIQSGVEIMARGGSMLLIGGAQADIARAKPWLDAMASLQTVMGPVGAGSAAKVVNNAVAHAVYVVLVEALAMARANGIGTDAFVDLLRGPDAGLMRPLTHRIGERVAGGNYAPGMLMEAARKDSTLALAMAQQDGIPLFAVQAAHTVYELACAQGMGREDYAALAKLWPGL